MEMIEEQVSPALKNALKKLDINYFLTSDNQLINHRVFYCNTWDDAKNKEGLAFIELLKSECDHLKTSFEKCTLIQVNIINAPPDCNNQLFHIENTLEPTQKIILNLNSIINFSFATEKYKSFNNFEI